MRLLRLNHSCRVWFGQASSCNLQGASGGAALGHFSAIKRLGSVSRKAWLTGGAGQTGEQQQATWAESCQEPASSLLLPCGLPFSRSTDGPLSPGFLLKVPRIHPRDMLLRVSAAGCTPQRIARHGHGRGGMEAGELQCSAQVPVGT